MTTPGFCWNVIIYVTMLHVCLHPDRFTSTHMGMGIRIGRDRSRFSIGIQWPQHRMQQHTELRPQALWARTHRLITVHTGLFEHPARDASCKQSCWSCKRTYGIDTIKIHKIWCTNNCTCKNSVMSVETLAARHVTRLCRCSVQTLVHPWQCVSDLSRNHL